ncbi:MULTISPECIES: DUF4386 domain-containing protein [unclassified Paenibacillus]|uniref:DUF4386 domain-containing protein n=1 Tax=unclassified Paenibacillus TaxID=185978 RepID=UPI0009309ED2|nr:MULTISPECIES: DUF4386 domain-containing protein [unclassified Paenibacillus]
MDTYQRNAKLAGALFLLATAAFMTGSGIIDAVLNEPEFLARLYPERMKVLAGLSLELINSIAVVGIAMLMYPILKPQHESLALGYFGSRIIEAVLLAVGMLMTLMLVAVSEDYIAAGNDESDGYFAAIGSMMIRGQDMAFELAMLALGLGSLMFCYVLYRTRLIPRGISLLGVIGYLALLANSCLKIGGVDPGYILFIPGGIFEIVCPLWLIVKGVRLTVTE